MLGLNRKRPCKIPDFTDLRDAADQVDVFAEAAD
jgi:hypothetical protein